MEYISIGIKDSNWDDVVEYLHNGKNAESNPKLYCELQKLNKVCQNINKLKHTWAKHCKMPNMDNIARNVANYSEKEQEIIKDLNYNKTYIEDLNQTIYKLLTNLENDIKCHMQKQYSLSKAYTQLENANLPDMFDSDSAKYYLEACLNRHLFSNKNAKKATKNVIDTYYYLLDMQYYLTEFKKLGPNSEVDNMLKLAIYAKAQLKQILDDLGCKIYVEHYEQNINLEKRKPKDKGRGWQFDYTPAAERWGL